MNFTASITGNLVKSELKFSQQGKPLWRGRVAVNHKRKNPQTNAYEDSGTSWVSVTAFGHLAENAANRLHDKMLVSVSGRMETRAWQKDDGTEGQSLEMIADTIAEAVAPWPDKNVTPPATAQSAPADPWSGQPSNSAGSWGTPETAPAW